MGKIKQQLKKGILDIAILKFLEAEDYYGYDLMQSLNTKSDNVFALKEGTLYPILYRLEDGQMIKSYWKTEDESRSKPRKYYSITDEGKKIFKEAKDAYLQISNGLNKILQSD